MRWFRRRTRVEGLRVECGMCGAFVENGAAIGQHIRDYHSEMKSWGVRVIGMNDYVVSCDGLQQAADVQDSLRDRGIESKVVTL